jgi:hypothetical protein
VAAGAAAAAADQQEVPGSLNSPLSRSPVPAQPSGKQRGKRPADDDDNTSMHSSKYSRSSSGAKVEQDLSGMEGDIHRRAKGRPSLSATPRSKASRSRTWRWPRGSRRKRTTR